VEIISDKMEELGALCVSYGRGDDCRCTFTGKQKVERIVGFNVGARSTEY